MLTLCRRKIGTRFVALVPPVAGVRVDWFQLISLRLYSEFIFILCHVSTDIGAVRREEGPKPTRRGTGADEDHVDA